MSTSRTLLAVMVLASLGLVTFMNLGSFMGWTHQPAPTMTYAPGPDRLAECVATWAVRLSGSLDDPEKAARIHCEAQELP